MAYDPHELKILRRGVSVEKVIAAYRHFGSLRKAGHACGISKDTVQTVLDRYNVGRPAASLPRRASYNPKRSYSDFAKWHKAHASDKDLPLKLTDIAKLAGVTIDVAKSYFYRRRLAARKILESLPDLRELDLTLEDIEGHTFSSSYLLSYKYAIDRYSARGAIQGKLQDFGEVTVLIPSIEQFASRVRKSNASGVEGQAERKSRLP